MEGLEALRNLLVAQIQGDLIKGKNAKKDNCRYYAQLREGAPDAKLKKVDIHGIPKGSILIKLDSYEQPRSLFKNDKGQRQRCDYVLFTIMDGKKFMIFIEMKSNKVKNNEIMRQFKGSECVIDYCHAALKRFHDYSELIDTFDKRFIVFYKSRISKKPTQTKRSSGIQSRNTYIKYPNPHNPSLKYLLSL